MCIAICTAVYQWLKGPPAPSPTTSPPTTSDVLAAFDRDYRRWNQQWQSDETACQVLVTIYESLLRTREFYGTLVNWSLPSERQVYEDMKDDLRHLHTLIKDCNPAPYPPP